MQSTQNTSHNSLQHLIAKGTHCQPTCYCSIDYLPCLHQIHFLCFVSCRCWTCSVSPTPRRFTMYLMPMYRIRSVAGAKRLEKAHICHGTICRWYYPQIGGHILEFQILLLLDVFCEPYTNQN